MKQIVILLSGLIWLGSCQIDGDKQVDRDKFDFKTTDDTELFFKNVRQLYYDLEELPAGNLNVFRIKSRNTSDNTPVINIAIVMNWLKDEAYVLIEPSSVLAESGSLSLKWENQESGTSGQIELSSRGKEAMLEFATRVYEEVKNGSSFSIDDDDNTPILVDSEEREAIRKTMSDYYRLTRIF
ncbi:MAG: hypothetical protein AAFX87_13135 [Bacteroidota bacterium]